MIIFLDLKTEIVDNRQDRSPFARTGEHLMPHHRLAAATAPLLLILPLVLLALAAGCGGGDDGGTAPPDGLPEDLAADLAELDAMHAAADDLVAALLAAAPDTAAALDSLAAVLAADPAVAACEVTEQGVAIDHASGLRSAFVLDFADHPELARSAPPNRGGGAGDPLPDAPRPAGSALPADAKGLVTNPRTGFVNPHHHERQGHATGLLELYDEFFPRIGFHQPERYFDAEATVEKFTFLDGYGVLHLYSHGVRLGGGAIGLMTGEAVSEGTSARYARDLADGRLAIIHPHERPDLYAVLPDFVTSHNDLAADSTLVWGGFCYSGLGGWPQALIADGARGYFGFDWSVYTVKNVAWAASAMGWLTDTSVGAPRDVASWFLDAPVALSYWYPRAERTVSCLYWGDPQATLWEIEADYDPAEFTGVQIHIWALRVEAEWDEPERCGEPFEQLIQGYVNRGFQIDGATSGLLFTATFDDSEFNWGTVTVGLDSGLAVADSLVIHEFKVHDGLGYTDEVRITLYDLPLVAVDTWPGGAGRVRFEGELGDLMGDATLVRATHGTDCVAHTTGWWLDDESRVTLWFELPVPR